MKNSILKNKSFLIVFASALIMSFTMFSCTKDDASLSVMFSLSGNASGSQMVPSNSSTSGTGTYSGSYNSSTKVMTYTSTWANLTSTPIAAGIYSGASGISGTLVAALSLGSNLPASGGSASGSVTLNATQETQLFQGNMYYLFSTTSNVSGEIRGQIVAQKQ